MFDVVFSSDDDEVIADGVWVWVTDHICAPASSGVRYLAKGVERDTPFSPRLRWVSIRVIEHIWRRELEMSGLEIAPLLDRLDVDADDVVEGDEWVLLLVGMVRLPAGPENVSPRYWRLLGKLTLATNPEVDFALCDVEVMKLLEEAEDWEKLEVWMVIMWLSLSRPAHAMTEQIAIDIEHSTLKLLLQRPSVLLRFEDLSSLVGEDAVLRRICDQAQVGRLAPEPPLPP